MQEFINTLLDRGESACIVVDDEKQIRYYHGFAPGNTRHFSHRRPISHILHGDGPLIITCDAAKLTVLQPIKLRAAMDERTVITFATELPPHLPCYYALSDVRIEPQNSLAFIDEATERAQAKLDYLNSLRRQYVNAAIRQLFSCFG